MADLGAEGLRGGVRPRFAAPGDPGRRREQADKRPDAHRLSLDRAGGRRAVAVARLPAGRGPGESTRYLDAPSWGARRGADLGSRPRCASATTPTRTARRPAALAVAAAVLALLCLGGSGALAQDLQSQLEQRQSELQNQQDRKGVLSTELSGYEERLDQLAGEVATLRNREAIVVAELRRVQARLNREKDRLERLKHQLRRSLNVLRNRLVGIYRSSGADLLTVMLESDGFDDLRLALRVPAPDRGAGLHDRRPGANPPQRHHRDGRARDRGPQRDRGQEGRARAHPGAARVPRGGARLGARPQGGRARRGAVGHREARGRHRRHPGPDPGADPGRDRDVDRNAAGRARSRAPARASSGRSTARSARRSAGAGGACTRASTSPFPPGPRFAPPRRGT